MVLDQQDLIELIDKSAKSMIEIFKDKYVELLKQYYFIGGMPEVVNSYREEKNYLKKVSSALMGFLKKKKIKDINKFDLKILYSTKSGRERIKELCTIYGVEPKQITKLKLNL